MSDTQPPFQDGAPRGRPDIDQKHGVWRCVDCGEIAEPVSPEWRWAGDHWQHYHGYPAGHVETRYFGADPDIERLTRERGEARKERDGMECRWLKADAKLQAITLALWPMMRRYPDETCAAEFCDEIRRMQRSLRSWKREEADWHEESQRLSSRLEIARQVIDLLANDFLRIHPDKPEQFYVLPVSCDVLNVLLRMGDHGEFTREGLEAIENEELNPGLPDDWVDGLRDRERELLQALRQAAPRRSERTGGWGCALCGKTLAPIGTGGELWEQFEGHAPDCIVKPAEEDPNAH